MPIGASNMRVDPLLTKASQMITVDGFIHDKVLPSIGVNEYKGKIANYGTDHLRDFDTRRSFKDLDYNLSEHNIDSQISYEIKYHDIAEVISDLEYKNYQKPFDARQDSLVSLSQIKNISMEIDLAGQLNNASLMTNTSTPATLWDAASSDPLGDMETAAEAIRSKIGRRPTYAVTNSVVLSKLKGNAQFLDKISGIKRDLSQAEIVDIIKNHLKITDLYIGSALYVNSQEGQTVTKTDIWADDFILYYAPPTGSLRVPSFGYRLFDLNKPEQVKVGRYYTDKGDVVEMNWALEDKVINIDASYLLNQVIT